MIIVKIVKYSYDFIENALLYQWNKINPFINNTVRATNQLKLLRFRRSEVAIDAGANIGTYTRILANHGAEVIALEPNKIAFNSLNQKYSNNPKIKIVNKGLYDINCKMPLYMHKNAEEDPLLYSIGSSIIKSKGNVGENSENIELIGICELIDSIDKKIKLLKMDVEGAENKILLKLIDTEYYKKITHIFVETHDADIPELKEETDHIRQLIRKKRIKNINLNWV